MLWGPTDFGCSHPPFLQSTTIISATYAADPLLGPHPPAYLACMALAPGLALWPARVQWVPLCQAAHHRSAQQQSLVPGSGSSLLGPPPQVRCPSQLPEPRMLGCCSQPAPPRAYPHACLCWAICRKGGRPRVLNAACPLAAVDLFVWPLLFTLYPNLLRPCLLLPPLLLRRMSVVACAHGPLPLHGGMSPANMPSFPTALTEH